MPILKPCRSNCSHLVSKQQPCPVHGVHVRPIDQRRGNANARGYNYRWQQYAKRYLARNPLCAHCSNRGRIAAATLVDHIVPVQSSTDPNFWDTDNHQPLCPSCHGLKTQRDQQLGLTRNVINSSSNSK